MYRTIQKLLNFPGGGWEGEGEDRAQSRNFPKFVVREDSLPSLNNIILVHILTFYSITIYFNIILPLRLGIPDDFPPSEIWTKILYSFPLIPYVLHAPSITLHVSLVYQHHHYLVKSIRHGSLHKTLDLKQYRPMVFQNFSDVEFFSTLKYYRETHPCF